MERLRYATWVGWELYDTLSQSLFWVLIILIYSYQICYQRSYRYAEDYLFNKNSTITLLMLGKCYEFWETIVSFSKWYFACLNLPSRLQKEYQGKWTINLTNCFELHYSTKYLWCEIACQRNAEPMISNYWEIAALSPTSNKIVFMGKLQL